jgi:hypothetical protein
VLVEQRLAQRDRPRAEPEERDVRRLAGARAERRVELADPAPSPEAVGSRQMRGSVAPPASEST